MALRQDFVYLGILISSIIASFLVKKSQSSHRDILGAFIGLTLVTASCEKQLMYSLVTVLINLAIIRLCAKNMHLVSFALCFGYLAFFRCAHYLGFPQALPYANAVQLLMTLRCVGLAFEIQDNSNYPAKENPQETGNSDRNYQRPNIKQQFCYCYNIIGLFTGPYYTYKVYRDMIVNEHLENVPFGDEVTPRLCVVPIYVIIFLIAQYLFPLDYVRSNEFYAENGFFARLFYMVPVFVQFRARCYIAWSLSEVSCIIAGLGAYPKNSKPKCFQGPTEQFSIEDFNKKPKDEIRNTEFDFETIKNVDPFGCEFACTLRQAMRSWNRTVQCWLAVNVYKRSPKSIRTALTFLISAYWHGVHPGYFLAFLTIPLCLLAEDLFTSVFFPTINSKKDRDENKKSNDSTNNEQNNLNSWNKAYIFWWFFRMRCFEYTGMGFLLLTWVDTINYWWSVYFCLHLCLAAIILFCYAAKTFMK